MSSSNQRPANKGFRSVLRCVISHYRQAPSHLHQNPFKDSNRTALVLIRRSASVNLTQRQQARYCYPLYTFWEGPKDSDFRRCNALEEFPPNR